MIAGHYATALIPYTRMKQAPLLLLLVCAQLEDLLWVVFDLIGLERLEPDTYSPTASLSDMQVEMTYSHDMIPVLI